MSEHLTYHESSLHRSLQKFLVPGQNRQPFQEVQSWVREHPEAIHPIRQRRDGDHIRWVDESGSDILRNVDRERTAIQGYFDREQQNNPGYYDYLEQLADSPLVQPMTSDCRVAITIPARQEGRIIETTLSLITRQTDNLARLLPTSLWEINIMNNTQQGIPFDDSREKIKRFMEKSNPDQPFAINLVDGVFYQPYATAGHARKIITDLTLLRSLQRPDQQKSLYIAGEDADIEATDPLLVFNTMTVLDKYPHLDAVQGIVDRHPEILMQNDYLFLLARVKDIRRILLKGHLYRDTTDPNYNFIWNRIMTSGSSGAYTAEAYALTEGYNPTAAIGEDIALGQMFSLIHGERDGTPNLHVIGRMATRNNSSPRRLLTEVARKAAEQEQQHIATAAGFMDEETNRTMRESNYTQLLKQAIPLARITPENSRVFAELIVGQVTWASSLVPDHLKEGFIRDFMLWIGFKREDYGFNSEGTLSIESWNNLSQALDTYREKHKKNS